MIGNSNDEYNFPHKLLLTNTQFSSVLKAFVNSSSANIKLSIYKMINKKNQFHKIGLSGGFLSVLLGTTSYFIMKFINS